jgi:pyruvate dehydrogenase E2 component (dihydrolipoyllysine-residue acetyltransferase)
MPIEITMPALSPTMEEGTLATWHVKEGDTVTSGDTLCEIETDKATMEVESIDEGIVGKILVADGTENVVVGTVIAVLLEDGESKEDIGDVAEVSPKPEVRVVREDTQITVEVEIKKPATAATTTSQAPAQSTTKPAAGDRVKASPLARRLASDAGLDIAVITGTGPRGRIVKADILAAQSSAPAVQAIAPAAPIVGGAVAAAEGDTPFEEVRLSSMRKVIAKRLTESKQTVPHFYQTVDARIDKLLALRKELNLQQDDTKISVNDFIVKASALALIKVPDANVQYGGNVLRVYSRADISIAVATDGGLITPIVRSADTKGLKAISMEVKDLAGRAREGKLMPEEYQGGTFSISNLGMFGIKEFSAVINPPQGAILAVGAGEPRPVIIDGVVQSATVMTMTLSVDHRAIDGAVGAAFLAAIKTYLENPLTMML